MGSTTKDALINFFGALPQNETGLEGTTIYLKGTEASREQGRAFRDRPGITGEEFRRLTGLEEAQMPDWILFFDSDSTYDFSLVWDELGVKVTYGIE